MRLEWIILAEGLGVDAKGAITAIGLNQNVLIAPTLPATTKRAIIAHFIEDGTDLKPGELIFFRVGFVSPSGKTISAQNGSSQFVLPRWPDVPGAIDLPAEMALNCSEYGTYRIEVSLQVPGGEELGGHLDLYVMPGMPAPHGNLSTT